jgi:hypothetical protein
MSTSRAERRKGQRRSTSLYVQFIDNRTGELIGDLADMSHEGFRLESMKQIPRNAEFSFRVDLPPEISQKPFIIISARSLWSRPDPIDGRLFDTGFEITRMDPGDARAFGLLYEQYGTGTKSGTGYLWKS